MKPPPHPLITESFSNVSARLQSTRTTSQAGISGCQKIEMLVGGFGVHQIESELPNVTAPTEIQGATVPRKDAINAGVGQDTHTHRSDQQD